MSDPEIKHKSNSNTSTCGSLQLALPFAYAYHEIDTLATADAPAGPLCIDSSKELRYRRLKKNGVKHRQTEGRDPMFEGATRVNKLQTSQVLRVDMVFHLAMKHGLLEIQPIFSNAYIAMARTVKCC